MGGQNGLEWRARTRISAPTGHREIRLGLFEYGRGILWHSEAPQSRSDEAHIERVGFRPYIVTGVALALILGLYGIVQVILT